MIIGKDKYRVKCYRGTLKQSANLFNSVAQDMRLILDRLEKDGICPVDEPYWRLSYDIGCCEETARICENELGKG